MSSPTPQELEEAKARAERAESEAAAWKADAAIAHLKNQELRASLLEAVGALETFAIMANEDTAYLPDEHVVTLTYDDSELDDDLGGPNTLLGERFMRAFRRAARVHTRLSSSLQPVGGELSGWSPIESAPQDGTVIDVWRPEGGRDTVFWGYPPHECGEMGQYCDSDWHRIRAPGWVCSTFGEFLGRKHAPFTHWRPLPPPPEHQAVGAAK